MSLLSSSIGLGALALPLLLVGVTALVLIATVVVLWRSRPKAPTSTSGGNPALAGPGTAASTNADAVSGRLAAIVESSNDAIIGKTLDGRITSWNAAATAMFGYSADEAIGRPVQMLIPEQREAEEMHILTQLARGMRVPAFDTVRRAKDGRLLEVSVAISPIRDAQGRVIGASKIARDVSSQRRAEAALRESEARLRFTLEAAQIGDWELDLASGAARRSLRHDRCFGYETLQPEWGFDTFLRHVHPDDRNEVRRSFESAVRDLEDWNVECRVVWPDASVHWIGAHGSIVREPGKPPRMLGIVIDLTMQKLAEQARLTAQRLETENRQIQQASRLKSQFLANMSHELRTPLNAIIGFADLLHAGAVPPGSPKQREFLGHIGTSGRHLLQLINDVLDLSKVESGKLEFFPEPVRLATIVDEVRDVLHASIVRKRIQLATELDATLTDLVLDPTRLKQALYNYLSNAIKFTPQGGRVTVRAHAEGPQHLRIEVEDTGIGIAAADIPRLFVEFQQLDSGATRQYPGTGLGLSLTRRLVQAQGGTVGVRSTPGLGSVFHLVLRRVHVPGAPVDTTGHRLLVIEDDDREQSRLARSLSDAGFLVDTASTGEQAVQQALNTSYDAITLDLLLPDQRGLDVLADIRNHGPSREAPVVGMTMPADACAAAGFAIADVIGKPIRADEVAAAMARLRPTLARRARVLVIDDDRLALDLMQATLGGLGIETVCRLDGREALREIDQVRPDAIVLDLMMPGIDGFEVLDALRQMPSGRDTPVFIWTSMILTDDEYASLARSARAILGKGGGALAAMLEDLRRWRPATAPQGSTSE
ncbi:MAG: PAS domain S-box protein [Burkholderiales bacterium]|nr:PAS domain S-box protein [Burkholderiales bacterium]